MFSCCMVTCSSNSINVVFCNLRLNGRGGGGDSLNIVSRYCLFHDIVLSESNLVIL